MTEGQIRFLRNRVHSSMERKEKKLHPIWARIIKEFRINADYVGRFVVENLDTALGNPNLAAAIEAGRTPRLNMTIRKWVALLAMHNPYFMLRNQNPADEAIAWLLEQQLENLERITGQRKVRVKLRYAAALMGTGIIKLGYGSELVYDEEPWADTTPKGAADLGDDKLLPYGPTVEHKPQFKPGDPVAFAVHPRDMFFDVDARVVDEITQYYHRFNPRVIDVLHDDRWDRNARKAVYAHHPQEESKKTYPEQDKELLRLMRRTELVEIYDVPSRQWCVISLQAGVDEPLRDWTPFALEIERPYRLFQPIPDPESPWGIPYALTILGSIMGINELRAKLVDSIGRGGKKVLVFNKTDLEDEDVDVVKDAAHLEIVGINSLGDVPFDQLFHMIDFSVDDAGLLSLQRMLDGDYVEASGLDDPNRFAYRDNPPTATEISTRSAAQSIGVDDMREEYETVLQDVMADLCRIMLQKWPESKLVKVVANDPRIYFWIEIERARVLRDFVLEVKAGSTEKMDKALFRRQLTDLLPRIMELKNAIDADEQRVAQGGSPSPVNPTEILRAVLEEFSPQFADRVLQRKDPATILRRLLAQGAQIDPQNISPELLSQLQPPTPAGAPPPGQQPSNMVDFEARQGVPSPQNVQGALTPDMAAAQSGRMLSEAGGA